MSDFDKLNDASDNIVLVRRLIDKATTAADPVERRRQMVRSARTLRTTADLLDDHGALEE